MKQVFHNLKNIPLLLAKIECFCGLGDSVRTRARESKNKNGIFTSTYLLVTTPQHISMLNHVILIYLFIFNIKLLFINIKINGWATSYVPNLKN